MAENPASDSRQQPFAPSQATGARPYFGNPLKPAIPGAVLPPPLSARPSPAGPFAGPFGKLGNKPGPPVLGREPWNRPVDAQAAVPNPSAFIGNEPAAVITEEVSDDTAEISGYKRPAPKAEVGIPKPGFVPFPKPSAALDAKTTNDPPSTGGKIPPPPFNSGAKQGQEVNPGTFPFKSGPFPHPLKPGAKQGQDPKPFLPEPASSKPADQPNPALFVPRPPFNPVTKPAQELKPGTPSIPPSLQPAPSKPADQPGNQPVFAPPVFGRTPPAAAVTSNSGGTNIISPFGVAPKFGQPATGPKTGIQPAPPQIISAPEKKEEAPAKAGVPFGLGFKPGSVLSKMEPAAPAGSAQKPEVAPKPAPPSFLGKPKVIPSPAQAPIIVGQPNPGARDLNAETVITPPRPAAFPSNPAIPIKPAFTPPIKTDVPAPVIPPEESKKEVAKNVPPFPIPGKISIIWEAITEPSIDSKEKTDTDLVSSEILDQWEVVEGDTGSEAPKEQTPPATGNKGVSAQGDWRLNMSKMLAQGREAGPPAFRPPAPANPGPTAAPVSRAEPIQQPQPFRPPAPFQSPPAADSYSPATETQELPSAAVPEMRPTAMNIPRKEESQPQKPQIQEGAGAKPPSPFFTRPKPGQFAPSQAGFPEVPKPAPQPLPTPAESGGNKLVFNPLRATPPSETAAGKISIPFNQAKSGNPPPFRPGFPPEVSKPVHPGFIPSMVNKEPESNTGEADQSAEKKPEAQHVDAQVHVESTPAFLAPQKVQSIGATPFQFKPGQRPPPFGLTPAKAEVKEPSNPPAPPVFGRNAPVEPSAPANVVPANTGNMLPFFNQARVPVRNEEKPGVQFKPAARLQSFGTFAPVQEERKDTGAPPAQPMIVPTQPAAQEKPEPQASTGMSPFFIKPAPVPFNSGQRPAPFSLTPAKAEVKEPSNPPAPPVFGRNAPVVPSAAANPTGQNKPEGQVSTGSAPPFLNKLGNPAQQSNPGQRPPPFGLTPAKAEVKEPSNPPAPPVFSGNAPAQPANPPAQNKPEGQVSTGSMPPFLNKLGPVPINPGERPQSSGFPPAKVGIPPAFSGNAQPSAAANPPEQSKPESQTSASSVPTFLNQQGPFPFKPAQQFNPGERPQSSGLPSAKLGAPPVFMPSSNPLPQAKPESQTSASSVPSFLPSANKPSLQGKFGLQGNVPSGGLAPQNEPMFPSKGPPVFQHRQGPTAPWNAGGQKPGAAEGQPILATARVGERPPMMALKQGLRPLAVGTECQNCRKRVDRDMIYEDVSCAERCQVCKFCYIDNVSKGKMECPRCKRGLHPEEVNTIDIYKQTMPT